MSETYVYFEPQDAALCGVHALNTLLQEPVFTEVELSSIAHELDREEERYMLEGGQITSDTLRYLSEGSGNVDDSGNFSIEVLRKAVVRSHGVSLVSWSSEEGKSTTDITTELGFIVNRSSHWFTIRRVADRWWNLNSTLPHPELVSPTYLSAMLAQLRSDGYTVFLAKGQLPPGSKPFAAPKALSTGAKWYTEKELLAIAGPVAAQTYKVAFPGAGRRLVDRNDGPSGSAVLGHGHGHGHGQSDDDFLMAQAISASLALDKNNNGSVGNGGGLDIDDPDLALAIALSQSEAESAGGGKPTASSASSGPLTKEQMRLKRLEALNAK